MLLVLYFLFYAHVCMHVCLVRSVMKGKHFINQVGAPIQQTAIC